MAVLLGRPEGVIPSRSGRIGVIWSLAIVVSALRLKCIQLHHQLRLPFAAGGVARLARLVFFDALREVDVGHLGARVIVTTITGVLVVIALVARLATDLSLVAVVQFKRMLRKQRRLPRFQRVAAYAVQSEPLGVDGRFFVARSALVGVFTGDCLLRFWPPGC